MGRPSFRAGISIEALVPSGERKLQMSADTEILEAAETLETFTERPLVIVTSDLGMELPCTDGRDGVGEGAG